jgi:putative membrane protein
MSVEGAYLWVKAFHVMAVISWMAGMFYLPRLYVYHVDAPKGSQQSETFKAMERRLLRAIINPAMVASWLSGLWMAWYVFGMKGAWLHWKLFLVFVFLSGFHGLLARWRRAFAEDRNIHSGKFYRVMNEVPTLIMIAVVILVIVKP